MSAKKLEIDLTGKTLDEVVQTLKAHGYNVTSSRTTMYDEQDRALRGKKEPGLPVHVVWMCNVSDDECKLLTVKIFNGKNVTLEPGQDLHLFDNENSGQDWSVVRSMNVMR
jgi:hypothetical protein